MRPISYALATLLLCALLAGCSQTPVAPTPVPPASSASDPQDCVARAECTTKLSRTLLFVFDYAAQGAPLLQREGRVLFTPADAPASDWPAVYIRLAEAEQSRFDFNGQCRASACRLSVEQLLAIYRSYLADRPCAFSTAPCRLPGGAIEPR